MRIGGVDGTASPWSGTGRGGAAQAPRPAGDTADRPAPGTALVALDRPAAEPRPRAPHSGAHGPFLAQWVAPRFSRGERRLRARPTPAQAQAAYDRALDRLDGYPAGALVSRTF